MTLTGLGGQVCVPACQRLGPALSCYAKAIPRVRATASSRWARGKRSSSHPVPRRTTVSAELAKPHSCAIAKCALGLKRGRALDSPTSALGSPRLAHLVRVSGSKSGRHFDIRLVGHHFDEPFALAGMRVAADRVPKSIDAQSVAFLRPRPGGLVETPSGPAKPQYVLTDPIAGTDGRDPAG